MLLVHRPEYDDWTLPKGKRTRRGRSGLCAPRGGGGDRPRCEPERSSPRPRTATRAAGPRRFATGRCAHSRGSFSPHDEIDEVRWLALPEAAERLTHGRDRDVLASSRGRSEQPVVLMRHASAGKRERWSGDDRLRPLDERGRKQAHGLVAALARSASIASARALMSDACRRSSRSPRRSESGRGTRGAGRGGDAGRRPRLARRAGGSDSALCAHGDIVELLLGPELALEKGAARILETTGSTVVPGQYIPAPEG